MDSRIVTAKVVTMRARERARRRSYHRTLPGPPARDWFPVRGVREVVGSFAVFAPLTLALRALVVSHFDFSVAESLIVYTGSLPYVAVTLVAMVPAGDHVGREVDAQGDPGETDQEDQRHHQGDDGPPADRPAGSSTSVRAP